MSRSSRYRWIWSPVLMLSLVACITTTNRRTQGAGLANFVVEEFVPDSGAPAWELVTVVMNRMDGDRQRTEKAMKHASFAAGALEDVTLRIAYGTYKISLRYADQGGKVLYLVCQQVREKQYLINTPSFKTEIPICLADNGGSDPAGTGSQVGTVVVAPTSDVTITPKPASPTPTDQQAQPSASTSPGAGGDAANCTDGENFDVINGACISRAKSFYVADGEVYSSGQRLRLAGVNWFGLEGTYLGLHGIGWTSPQRKLEDFVQQMHDLGFNAFRIPISPEALNPNSRGQDSRDPKPLDQLQRLLTEAANRGMYVLLDLHTCASSHASTDKPAPGVGSCAFYSESAWTADLRTLANLSLKNANVVGIDLFNEPYGLSWDDWRGMSERGGAEILKINPRTLIFVEGVADRSTAGKFGAFWGENLTEAGAKMPNIPQSRLVFSPHAYGPSVADQSYFHDGAYPRNLAPIWEEHFGYLRADGHAVVMGEFGGTYEGSDKSWQDAFVDYQINKGITSFFYWSMNPNSGDTKGLLLDDWRTVNQGKMTLLRRLLQNP